MNNSFKNVKVFHETFGHPINQVPTPVSKAFRELRVRMLAEELAEIAEALGVDLTLDALTSRGARHIKVEAKAYAEDVDVDLVAAAKELSDLDYVTQGTYIGMGIPGAAVEQLTHDSNMSKLDEDGNPIYREDGKVLKGPKFWKAETKIAPVLKVCQRLGSRYDFTEAAPDLILQADKFFQEVPESALQP